MSWWRVYLLWQFVCARARINVQIATSPAFRQYHTLLLLIYFIIIIIIIASLKRCYKYISSLDDMFCFFVVSFRFVSFHFKKCNVTIRIFFLLLLMWIFPIIIKNPPTFANKRDESTMNFSTGNRHISCLQCLRAWVNLFINIYLIIIIILIIIEYLL